MRNNEIKNLKITHLALVKRGANKVNRSVLKSQKIDDFFTDTADDSSDDAVLMKSEEVLSELTSIYNSDDAKGELKKFLESNGVEFEAAEDSEDEVQEVTADDLLNE